jgi:hypothetical protein
VENKLRAGHAASDSLWYDRKQLPLAPLAAYCADTLDRYTGIWAEAMLWAALQFIREELGIRRVFYHSEAGGRLLKHIRWSAPPRSLYTELPRRFCFAPTRERPAFLEEDKETRQLLRQHPEIEFFCL